MPEDKEAPVYTAEKIVLKRVRKGKVEYFIKWKGWAAKHNTWEPEKHIIDKALIDDYNNRTRKEQKSKSVAAKPKVTRKTRQTSSSAAPASRTTRRIQSSTSSDISTSAIVSPETNNDENDEIEQESYKLRSKQPDRIQPNFKELSDSSKESEEDEEAKQTNDQIPQLDESIRKFLWQPTEFNLRPCTMTEITDSTGSTVLIREIDGKKAKH